MGVKILLDLAGINIFTATDDHVLAAAGDAVVAVGDADGDVAGTQPAVRRQHGCGFRRLVVVALHDAMTADDHLAGLAVRHIVHGPHGHNADVRPWNGPANRADALFQIVLG